MDEDGTYEVTFTYTMQVDATQQFEAVQNAVTQLRDVDPQEIKDALTVTHVTLLAADDDPDA